MNVNCACGCGKPAPVAIKTNTAKGHVKGSSARFISGHNLPLIRKAPVEARFWRRVAGTGVETCWEWQGGGTGNGYGRFVPQRGTWVLAHRWAYEALRTDIPAGLDLDHLCANRGCVNPWHLEPVTRQVNTLRGRARRRAAQKLADAKTSASTPLTSSKEQRTS